MGDGLSPDLPGPVGSASAVEQALLDWGQRALRPLPWRQTRDPWAVLVAEVMSQQTGVDRVVPTYHDFLERFPDPAACAAVASSEVVRAWSGLGYNRRAINLHRCATALVEHHGGVLPDDLGALLALPGVGPYTARAVLAFAFERPVGVVDTNVGRVLARWEGRRLGGREAQALADALVPEERAWDWNQSLMELGGTICRRRAPVCGRCPVLDGCGWHRVDLAPPDPADGSAAVGRGQSRFEGSDRQGRGRLVDALRRAPVGLDELPSVMGWPGDAARARRVASGVVADGLAVRRGDTFYLPR